MTDPPGSFQRRRIAIAGLLILVALYGAALFADFLAPYAPNAEFREYFFHPPTSIHFRDPDGRLVWPYVLETHLSDERKHLYKEGSPIRVARVAPEENRNPYIAEMLETETPFAVIKNEKGSILAAIDVARETQDDSGVFFGQSVVDPKTLGSEFLIESGSETKVFRIQGKRFSAADTNNRIQLTDPTGRPLLSYHPAVRRYPLKLFVQGGPYKFLGIIPANLRLAGVEGSGHLFLMGTDQAGRDIFSRVLHGARVSLTVGLLGVCISTLLGLWIGGVAGYAGGKTDSLLMRSADILMSIPALYLILSVRNIFPAEVASEATYALMVIVLSLTGWASMARVIRGMVLALREEEYVLSARALGASSFRILTRHILPNTFGMVLVRATLLIPAYILAEVTLSYLGIGIQEPSASWGNMLSAAQEIRVLEDFPWVLTPAAFLFATVLGFNFLGDGLRRYERNL